MLDLQYKLCHMLDKINCVLHMFNLYKNVHITIQIEH